MPEREYLSNHKYSSAVIVGNLQAIPAREIASLHCQQIPTISNAFYPSILPLEGKTQSKGEEIGIIVRPKHLVTGVPEVSSLQAEISEGRMAPVHDLSPSVTLLMGNPPHQA